MTTLSSYRTPALLFAIPGIAVVWGIIMVHTALTYPDALVVDDYYKDGMGINIIRDRESNAEQLGVAAIVMLSGNSLTAHITTADDLVTLHFSHVVDAREDLFFEARRDPDGLYRITDRSLSALNQTGAWYVSLASDEAVDDAWRITRRVDTPVDQFTVRSK